MGRFAKLRLGNLTRRLNFTMEFSKRLREEVARGGCARARWQCEVQGAIRVPLGCKVP